MKELWIHCLYEFNRTPERHGEQRHNYHYIKCVSFKLEIALLIKLLYLENSFKYLH